MRSLHRAREKGKEGTPNHEKQEEPRTKRVKGEQKSPQANPTASSSGAVGPVLPLISGAMGPALPFDESDECSDEYSEDEANLLVEEKAYITWREELERALYDEGWDKAPLGESEDIITVDEWEAIATRTKSYEQPTVASLCFAGEAATYHNLGGQLSSDEVIEVTFSVSEESKAVIVKSFDLLTPEENIRHKDDVRQAKAKEIHDLFKL